MTPHLDGFHAEDGYGYLSDTEFRRFEWAVHNSRRLVVWLRVAGYVKSDDPDVGRIQTSSSMPLGVPPTWLAAEEIDRLIHELQPFPELADAANDQYGAWVALELVREVETARARWPFEDRPHRMKYMRCMACSALTLRFLPPRHEGDGIQVKCSDKDCGAVLDEAMFARAAALIEQENREGK